MEFACLTFIVKISKGVLGSCIPLPGVKPTHAVTSVSEKWLVEMLVTSICHQPLYPNSLLQQLGQSCPSLAQPLSRPLADNSRRHAGDPDIDASEQKMVVTTQTVGAQHDKELANIRALCLGEKALAGFSALLETNEAVVCQKIVCSQSEKQRISFKGGQKCRAHLTLQPAKAYSAELIHRESRRVDE